MDDEIILSRLFDKLDKIEKSVRDLCDRLTTVEIGHNNHLNELRASREDKDKRIYYAIAGVGTFLSLLQIYQILNL